MFESKYKIGDIVGWKNNSYYVGIITNLETRDDPHREESQITICWTSRDDREVQKGMFKSMHDSRDFHLILSLDKYNK